MINTLFKNFLLLSLASSVPMLCLLLAKKCLRKYISVKWQYHIGLMAFILFAVPLIPPGLLNSGNGLNPGRSIPILVSAVTAKGPQAANSMNRMQDFSMSVDRAPEYVIPILMSIWILGIAVQIVFTLLCNRNLRLIMASVKPTKNKEVSVLFDQCKIHLGVNKNIQLGTSILIRSPIIVGFFRTSIILPANVWRASVEDIRYILLHELTHCKNRDIPINNAMSLLQILYWFNPIAYLAFKELRKDRELACDLSVLTRLPRECHINYGKTLLKFVDEISCPATLSFATDMGSSKRQIQRRIESIASFTKESKLAKIKSVCIFAMVGILLLSQIPFISALAYDNNDKYYFQSDNVVYEDLSSFFHGFDGSFVLYDLDSDQYSIYNKEKSETRISPDSTYKLYSALIGMETGVIDVDNSNQKWDGIVYPYDTLNHDHNLASAMQNSVSWYFQTVDAQVGMENLNAYFTRLSYGNHDLSGGIRDYWTESTLRISPVEQVILLKDINQNNTIFNSEHVDALKDILRVSEKDGAVMSGKTGTGMINGKSINGWFIGYVESNANSYIFATNVQGKDNAGGSVAVQITLSILSHKGIY